MVKAATDEATNKNPLIQNYGLFWRLDKIFWGYPGVKAHLKGQLSTSSKIVVDFRYQQAIYILYDDNFKIVYAGQSGVSSQRLLSRLSQHTKDNLSDRWSRFSWFGLRRVNRNGLLRKEVISKHPDLAYVLNHIEAILISAIEPPHNRQGGRFGNDVQQYLQYFDIENVYPDVNEMIKALYDKICFEDSE